MSVWSSLIKALDGSTKEGQDFWQGKVGQKLVKAQELMQKSGAEGASVNFVKPFVKYLDQARLASQTFNSALGSDKPIDDNLIKRVQDQGMLSAEGKIGGRELWNTARNTADVALKVSGLANPGLAVQSMLAGAGMSPLVTAGVNAWQGKPITEGLGQSVVSGSINALANSGTTRLTQGLVQSLAQVVPILRPLTVESLKKGLPTAQDALGAGLRKWAEVAGKRLIKGAVLETLVETPIWASITQGDREKYVDALSREALQNLIYNVGFAGIDSLKDTRTLMPIVKTSIDTAINNYKNMPIEEKMGGYIQIPGRSRLARVQNEKFIQEYESKERHTAEEIKKYRELTQQSENAIKSQRIKPNFVDSKLYAKSLPNAKDGGVMSLNDITIPDRLVGEVDPVQMKIVQSQLENGDPITPIVVDENGVLKDGFHRLTTFKNNGIDQFPVVVQKTPSGKGNFGHAGVKGQRGGSAPTKITPEDISKYDNSLQYTRYNGRDGVVETYQTHLVPEDVPKFFSMIKDLESQYDSMETKRKDLLHKTLVARDPAMDAKYDALVKSQDEIRNAKQALENVVGFGNDPKEIYDRYARYVKDPSDSFKSIMDKIASLRITEGRREIDITGGKVNGYYDNTKGVGRKELTFGEVDKIKPKKNDGIVSELISDGWKGQIVNPLSRAFKSMLAKIYGVDVPIADEKTTFGNKAHADSMYNKQIDIATDPDNIGALKYAIEQEQLALKKAHPEGFVTLYRGLQTKNVNDDDIISSWSDDPAVATRFAGKKGRVVSQDVPIENIVLSHNTQKTLGRMGENMPDVIKGMFGPGEQEKEYIVINKPVEASQPTDSKAVKLNKSNSEYPYTYYHVTPASSAQEIMKNGFNTNDVYAFDSPLTAQMYQVSKGGGKPGLTGVKRNLNEDWVTLKIFSKNPITSNKTLNYKDIAISGIETSPVVKSGQTQSKPAQATKTTSPKWIRYADDVNKTTDDVRGGTWFTNEKGSYVVKDAMNPKMVSEVGIGGNNIYTSRSKPKKPLIIKDANLEDGSFSVINSGYENFIAPEYVRIASDLYEGAQKVSEKGGDIDMVIMDSLYNAGIPESQALGVLNVTGKNKFDSAMDLIISKALRDQGYDGLVLKSGDAEHLFNLAGSKVSVQKPIKATPKGADTSKLKALIRAKK